MRIVLVGLGVLVVLAGLGLLAGYLLPATREGRAETVILAPPEAVLRVIADVTGQQAWRSGIGAVERTADGWVETTERGERISFVAEEMTVRRVRLRFVSDAGYSGAWEAALTPTEGGTRISVVERATVPSPLGRILARLYFDPQAFATRYLAELKVRVEA
jgi:hypothetical protein